MTMKASFNRANPNTLADLFRKIGLGDLLRGQINQSLRMAEPAADVSQLATLESFGLAAKNTAAAEITRAYARATNAAGTLGELAIQAPNATPADAQIAVAPNGDIVVLAASDYVDVDVEYVPARGEVVTLEDQAVVANVFAIPVEYTARGVVYLMSATGRTIAGVATDKIIVAPGAPAATQAALDVPKANVNFNAADAVVSCDVTLLVSPSRDFDDEPVDLDTALEDTSDLIM